MRTIATRKAIHLFSTADSISSLPFKLNDIDFLLFFVMFFLLFSLQVLRRFPTMPQDVAELYASNMMSLATQARGVIRDLNPKVRDRMFFINL